MTNKLCSFESMTDKINEAFTNCNDPPLFQILGTICNATANEAGFSASDSSSVLDVDVTHASRRHLKELERVGMQGMLTHHQFVQADASVHMINWVSELVSCILASF
jgi:hypothetical protein